MIDFHVNEFNHDGFILPVKQYALVKAAKTPTSFEFSNEQRVAMVKWSIVKILCLCVINEVKESPTRLDTNNRKLRKLVVGSNCARFELTRNKTKKDSHASEIREVKIAMLVTYVRKHVFLVCFTEKSSTDRLGLSEWLGARRNFPQ